MQVLERKHELQEYGPHSLLVERLALFAQACEVIVQGGAVHQLHRDEELVTILEGFVEAHDVRMVQLGQDGHLVLHAARAGLPLGRGGAKVHRAVQRQHLERGVLGTSGAPRDALSAMHSAKGTRAHHLQDLVAAHNAMYLLARAARATVAADLVAPAPARAKLLYRRAHGGQVLSAQRRQRMRQPLVWLDGPLIVAHIDERPEKLWREEAFKGRTVAPRAEDEA
mmetsp:Transcript_6040/g.18152  ORF Transcript_6040/g.18152 Transcript_6040/m.18152 type:complete len:225 (+) Transcript_6040:1130-1804(+)